MDDWDSLIQQYGNGKGAQPAPAPKGDDWDELIRQHAPSQQQQPPLNDPRRIVAENAAADAAMAGPEGQKLAAELRHKADAELLASRDLGPGYAAASSFVNTLGMNVPRNLFAGIRSLQSGRPFGEEYNYVKSIDEAAARENKLPTYGGMLAGAIGAGALLPAVPAATAGARALMGGGIGAGIGGLSELADTKDPAKALQSAAIGGVIGGVAAPIAEKAVSGVVNAGGRVVSKVRGTAPQIPTKEEIKASSQAAYDAADQAGLIVKPQGVQTLWNDTRQMLANEGYHPSNQPKLTAFINELQNLQSGNVTLKGLETTRKMLRAARTDADAETRRFGAMAAERFDEFLTNLKPSDVLMGDAKGGVAALKEARSLWSSYRKADLVDEALQAAKMRAASTGSGGNVDNAIRQEFRKILQNKKKSQSFTDAEKAALARIVTGTQGQNTLRLLGKLSPAGDGLRLLLNAGAALHSGGATLPVSALGSAAKTLADRATPKNVERLSKIIRARGINIDPEDVIKAQQGDRLRNFFSSIGVNVEKMMQNEDQ